jgi:opacity protein-like surface antigen
MSNKKEFSRKMRKMFVLMVAVFALSMVAAATDFPQSEVFLGYNFTRFYPDSGYVPDFNANGGNGQFTYNFHKWLGATFDVGSVYKGTFNQTPWDTTITSYTVGPRFTYHNHSRFTPYVEALFGGAHTSTSTQVGSLAIPAVAPPVPLPPGQVFSTRITASNNGFAMLAGGGIDIKVFKRMSFRPIGLDYYLGRMPSAMTGNDTNHNNIRYTAGVSFLFGKM